MTLFILQNQKEQFLNKALEWVYGCSADDLFRTPYKDVALNQLIELNTTQVDLRARVVACTVDGKGRPVLPAESSESVA